MNGNEEKLEQLEKGIRELSEANKELTKMALELSDKVDSILAKMDEPKQYSIENSGTLNLEI